MKQLAIQVLLIVGILAIAWRLLGSYGQRAQALRRIGLLLFAAFAVWSILDPNILNRLGSLVGIGRGADLVLYGLVLAFLGFVVTTFRRFRDMEVRYTRLARRIALDETPPPAPRSAAGTEDGEDAAAATATNVTPEAPVTSETHVRSRTDEAIDEATEASAEAGSAGGIPDGSTRSGVTSATPYGGDDRLGTGRPERLAGSPSSSPSMKAADAD
ncbi:DUF2304 family protein [Monashia sp. NPDC004114]